MDTISSLIISAVTSFALSKDPMTQSSFMAIISTAVFPTTSDIVVMTGCAPIFSDSLMAFSFAPPRCPERRLITNSPLPSITSTAGSTDLCFR